MLTNEEQIAHGEKLVAVAGRWAESKGFGRVKTTYAKTFAAAVAAVQDGGKYMLTFDEMTDLANELAKVEIDPEEMILTRKMLANKMSDGFLNIPIAVTVLDGKVYGAYTGNWEPYGLPNYDPEVVTLAINMGLLQAEREDEIGGKPVTWWMNRHI